MSRTGVLVSLVLAVGACHAADAVVDDGGDASADAAPDVGIDFPGDGGFVDAAPGPRGKPDALAPPTVACSADADAGACAIPPSVCADIEWLGYFETKGCVDGTCAFESKLLRCKGYCADGGCVSFTMTAPAPP